MSYDLFHNGTHRKIVGSIRQWTSISAITFHLNTGDQAMESTVPLEMNRLRTVFPGFMMEQIDADDNRGYFAFSGKRIIHLIRCQLYIFRNNDGRGWYACWSLEFS